MILNWFFNHSSKADSLPSSEEISGIITQFEQNSHLILSLPKILAVAEYNAMVSYFETDSPTNTQVNYGVVFFKKHPEGNLIAQLFLDRNNKLVVRPDGSPFGRQLITQRIGKELQNRIKDKNILFVPIQNIQGHSSPEYNQLIDNIAVWLNDLLKVPEVLPILTYEEAIKYFVTNRPAEKRAVKGAILMKKHSQGNHISQVFLDETNQILYQADGKPYGRQLVAKQLDAELKETFDGKDLIIVE